MPLDICFVVAVTNIGRFSKGTVTLISKFAIRPKFRHIFYHILYVFDEIVLSVTVMTKT